MYHRMPNNQDPVRLISSVVNNNNVDILLEKYGIYLPNKNIPITQYQKVLYFKGELELIRSLFYRPENIQPPPILTYIDDKDIRPLLELYTIRELFDSYEVEAPWSGRLELINNIIQEAKIIKWRWTHKWCNNDDRPNILADELRRDIDKNDVNNPTLSYGMLRNYRCYQMDELTLGFHLDEEDNMYHFRDPDYIIDDIDPLTGRQWTEEFPIRSIRQLYELLQNSRYNTGVLINNIKVGLKTIDDLAIVGLRLNAEYIAMTPDQQYIVQLYLGWMFIYGMWMRFWKGPGHNWPTRWIEKGGGRERCDEGRREENILIQQSVHSVIIQHYEKDVKLKNWIENLPLVDYDFMTNEAKMATGNLNTIKVILDKILLGDFCMGLGSELILKTSYYLIKTILNITSIEDLNVFIINKLYQLIPIELQVINYKLANAKTQHARNTLLNRKLELENYNYLQPYFNPKDIQDTPHGEPTHLENITFGDNDKYKGRNR